MANSADFISRNLPPVSFSIQRKLAENKHVFNMDKMLNNCWKTSNIHHSFFLSFQQKLAENKQIFSMSKMLNNCWKTSNFSAIMNVASNRIRYQNIGKLSSYMESAPKSYPKQPMSAGTLVMGGRYVYAFTLLLKCTLVILCWNIAECSARKCWNTADCSAGIQHNSAYYSTNSA